MTQRLKLRYYRSEGTIRSIGDPPNGILAVDARELGDATWVISSNLQPGSRRLGGPLRSEGERRTVLLGDVPDNDGGQVSIDTESVVDGCDNDITRQFILDALAMAIAGSAALVKEGPNGLDVIESVVALARETIDLAVARGWARR